MRLPDEPDTAPQINIVPMIDVVFAVLVFFLLSSLFLTDSQGLTVALPGAQTSTSQPQRPVTVTLDASGQLSVADQPVTEDQLLPAVQALLADRGNPLVLIRADQTINHGRVVAVMDRLRTLPGVQLAIATQPQ
ncbi:MAG: ExbD/TolR family protein [Nodosilinea sp.]|jgi:biopolymer transport protein ExbD